ncbi:MAG: hypothetical protein IH909_04830, partial [Proteobacteria bacterium]|nr:hypothetical protein [Pseudomonadota bacterium]
MINFNKDTQRSGRKILALIPMLILGFTSNIAIAEDSKYKERPVLKVCADPQLMPFSNKNEEGLENK